MGLLTHQFDGLMEDFPAAATLGVLLTVTSIVIRNMNYPGATARLPKTETLSGDIKLGFFIASQALIYTGLVNGMRYVRGD